MYQWSRQSFEADAACMLDAMADGRLERGSAGILVGTRVASWQGFRPVETIVEGDRVLTFDRGLQPVRKVLRSVLWVGGTHDPESWPLLVPAGALGNHEALRLMPGQGIMIESDAAEAMLGDPFALLPAAALEGVRGIRRTRPAEWIEVVTLVFERDEVVFGNSGALFFCPLAADLMEAAFSEVKPGYEVMPLDAARELASDVLGLPEIRLQATA
jgi:hypothetical protein